MAIITTKYSVGDVVYHAGTTTARKPHPCPDCKGERKWKAISPAGSEYEFSCPRCAASYQSNRELSLDYTAHVPNVTRLTIGSVQFNSASGGWDAGARYMCRETGVGSGTVYAEDKLFSTEEEARQAAETFATVANTETPWVTKLYDKTLELSDYQLEGALLKVAKDEQSKARSLLYNIGDLFASIDEASDKDAVLEAVDDYKRYHLAGDKAEAEQVSA